MPDLISYAQNFEDIMLWRALKHVDRGCYIDIGAHSPDIHSISKLFYERGWRGIHIEPLQMYADALRMRRPDELVLQVAVSDLRGVLPFFDIADSGLSTAESDIADAHRANGFVVRDVTVVAITLDALLEHLSGREVHWLKIDVEGSEARVLRSWVVSPVRPWILVIEATRPMTIEPTHVQWEGDVLDKGYMFAYFDGLNRFYVSERHPELIAAFSCPPNVFDGFGFALESDWCVVARRQFEGYRDDCQKMLATSHSDAVAMRAEVDALKASEAVLRQVIEMHRENAVAAYMEVGVLKASKAALQQVIEAHCAKSEHLITEVDALHTMLDDIHRSHSWRVTRPLRAFSRMARLLCCSPRHVMRQCLILTMRPLLHHSSIRALLNGVVKRVPVLHRRLRSLAEREGLVVRALDSADVPVSVPQALDQTSRFLECDEHQGKRLLSSRGRAIYARMIGQINKGE
ncbi:FkbM family methyltransferase [Xylella taiwanensis]|uniref:Methyltransferase n=1 Tax=Xylella taiwanensis TaxID=1444770 RepID=Z9JMP0_9GAMM|nr:FkbM family methyltransferase [Xylella taiwanensis]AXI84038.1 methyltransferase [Xylella taiwanensis]EWS79041.1 methyltransferase [Xylella taiwanensis]MCD8457152.1 FkbM family methyltransferase [Xylella taiwanensis]MCD8459560.1 FkbM family methyltransferase [Xylella taiwanensis]MCD8461572.1 FkbM family methyltransferase [Xylella taiwanensis]